jgi:hypothetical protein
MKKVSNLKRGFPSAVLVGLLLSTAAAAYPPAVGTTGQSRSCTTCHPSNGPWTDEARTIIDLLDAATKKSLRQPDGSFLLEVPRGQTRKVMTIIGRQAGESAVPVRNAWLYVDPSQISAESLSTFAPGWEVDLPMSCRLVGDKNDLYANAPVTALSMTVRPTPGASDAEMELQIMLTNGKATKANTKDLISNYFVRKVRLKVTEPRANPQPQTPQSKPQEGKQ